MTAFDQTVEALRKRGLNSDEIIEVLSNLIKEFSLGEFNGEKVVEDIPRKSYKEYIQETFDKINVPKKRGYHYLFRAVEMNLESPKHFSKVLYPSLAQEFRVQETTIKNTLSLITKDIWDNCPEEVHEEIFKNINGFKKNGPSARQFICVITHWIKENMK